MRITSRTELSNPTILWQVFAFVAILGGYAFDKLAYGCALAGVYLILWLMKTVITTTYDIPMETKLVNVTPPECSEACTYTSHKNFINYKSFQ